jgi:hypothetical protein
VWARGHGPVDDPPPVVRHEDPRGGLRRPARLGEQNALRAIDVFFEHGYVHVNGSWITPLGAAGFRGPVKNHTLHEVPLPRSLMHDELLPRVKELLDLPATAPMQQVINAQEDERQRRASLANREKDRNLAWWNYPCLPRTSSGSSSTPSLAFR